MRLRRIISGGQTGVDRGALDAAMALGIEHGGTCPAGRLAEDGAIPSRYQLKEHSSPKYPPRTAKNICDADATMILVLKLPHRVPVTPGTKLTAKIAHERGKPWRAFNLGSQKAVQDAVDWLRETDPEVLNVAGPRETKFPNIQRKAAEFLSMVIGRLREK